MLAWLFVVLVGGYFLGCAHGSVLAQKLSGVNLKEAGTKNAGASNVTIVLGKKFGALVAAIDIGKGAIAVLFTRYFIGHTGLSEEIVWLYMFVVGASVMLGHIFPFYMKFDGGKGTATVIGILLAIDWRFGLIALGLFILVSLVTDFLVFGVLMLYVTLITLAVWIAPGIYPLLIAVGLFLIAAVKHIDNFERMRNGEEKRVSSVFRKRGKL